MKNMDALKNKLYFDIETMDKSIEVLLYSLKKAKKIGIKNEYTMEELEVFESLAGRFSRTSDILTQQIIKNLFIIMQEEAKTFIDRCNMCEKFEIVKNADDLYNIRRLRNDIAHEYCIVDITEIFDPLLSYCDLLLEVIHNTKNYIQATIKNIK